MINIGVVGYGNLGKACVNIIKDMNEMKLVCVFSRRDLRYLNGENVVFEKYENIKNYKGKIDVMIMCGGSAKDLMVQSKEVLKDFCIVDSFDTHAKILTHFKNLDAIAKSNKTLGLISCGWDPGLFSLMRLIFDSLSNKSNQCTFWGKGISQGHSDAIRRIDGVVDARQYTIPKIEAIKQFKNGEKLVFYPNEKHKRECFVAIKKGANKEKIEQEIKQMPYYFSDYDTKVCFVSQDELRKKHNKLYHAGMVLGSFQTKHNKNFMNFSIKMDDNPGFTASVLLCFSKAVFRLKQEKKTGALTIFDIPLKYLSDKDFFDQINCFL